MGFVPLDATPPDVLALPVDVARERLAAAGLRVASVAETSAWRPEPPAGAEWRVVRQRLAAPDMAVLVVAPFRPPASDAPDGSPVAGGGTEPAPDGTEPAPDASEPVREVKP